MEVLQLRKYLKINLWIILGSIVLAIASSAIMSIWTYDKINSDTNTAEKVRRTLFEIGGFSIAIAIVSILVEVASIVFAILILTNVHHAPNQFHFIIKLAAWSTIARAIVAFIALFIASNIFIIILGLVAVVAFITSLVATIKSLNRLNPNNFVGGPNQGYDLFNQPQQPQNFELNQNQPQIKPKDDESSNSTSDKK